MAKEGADITFGCEHPNYIFETTIRDNTRKALLKDLD